MLGPGQHRESSPREQLREGGWAEEEGSDAVWHRPLHLEGITNYTPPLLMSNFNSKFPRI